MRKLTFFSSKFCSFPSVCFSLYLSFSTTQSPAITTIDKKKISVFMKDFLGMMNDLKVIFNLEEKVAELFTKLYNNNTPTNAGYSPSDSSKIGFFILQNVNILDLLKR